MESSNAPELRAEALGFAESVVMGVAGAGPAYSVAACTATLVGAVGVYAPASLLYCELIMFGIVFSFRHLNRVAVNAGASYAWVATIFSPALGFFAGWTLLINAAVFMVSGTLPAASAILKLLAPPLVDHQRRGNHGGGAVARRNRGRRRQRGQAQQLAADRVYPGRGWRAGVAAGPGVAGVSSGASADVRVVDRRRIHPGPFCERCENSILSALRLR
jgi:amino acid transporter